MSELVTNKITPSTGSSDTVTLGDSGDTFTIPSGVNITNSGTATGFGGGKVAQIVTEVHTTYSTGSTNIPADDTIPTSSEGSEIITKAITPTSATNRLLFIFEGNLQNSSTQNIAFTLFQDSGAAAIAMGWSMCHMGNHQNHLGFTHDMVAGTTSSTTFKIRMGGESGTYRTNGSSSARRYGGISANRLTIIEYTP
jgi:hypothetical protein